MKPNLLQQSIYVLAQHIDGIDASDDWFTVLASIVAVRIQWLKDYLQTKDKPFSWEMPKAKFRDNAQIQVFLRGPNASMTTTGVLSFSGLPDVRKYATNTLRNTQVNASFTMEPGGRGKDSFVTIAKIPAWFSENERSLLSYKEERQRLTNRFGRSGPGGSAKKRARLE